MYLFTGVQPYNYWSGTSLEGYPYFAWLVHLYDGFAGFDFKDVSLYYVWPVRSDN